MGPFGAQMLERCGCVALEVSERTDVFRKVVHDAGSGEPRSWTESVSNNRLTSQLSAGDGSSAGGARRPTGAEEGVCGELAQPQTARREPVPAKAGGSREPGPEAHA